MNKLFFCIFGLDRNSLVDEHYRYLVKFEMLLLILGSISFLMGILNFFIAWSVFAVVDCFFSVICFIHYFLLRAVKKTNFINFLVFECLLVFYIIALLVTGGTAGYGTYWLLLLPAFGIGFLEKKRGVVLSVLIFLLSVAMLWIPFLRELCQYEYASSFRIVFPVLYVIFFSVGYGIEALRLINIQQMMKIQKVLQNVAEKDALTGIANRIWFNHHFIDKYDGKPIPTSSLVFLIDIDDFKAVNDRFGHLAGDEVLCRSAEIIRKHIGDQVLCRWGGEEFFAFVPSCDREKAKTLLEEIRNSVAQTSYRYKDHSGIKVTVSVGGVYIEANTVVHVEEILCEVDRQLYKSKAQGKNRINFC